MGVGLRPGVDGVGNLLLALAVPYSRPWRIALHGSSRTMQLGAPAPSDPLAAFQLRSDGQTASGQLAWNDTKANVCWTVTAETPVCEPTLFDSGETEMHFFGGTLGSTPTTAGMTS